MTPEEINRFIAEKVMGWHQNGLWWEEGNTLKLIGTGEIGVDIFDPYHRIDHAMMALEKVDYWTIYHSPDVYHVVLGSEDNPTPLISAIEDTPSAAICLALVEAKKGGE